jgi:hypothetical protein
MNWRLAAALTIAFAGLASGAPSPDANPSRPPAPEATITVTSRPAGARIYVGAEGGGSGMHAKGISPATVPIHSAVPEAPQRYRVTLTLPGYDSFSRIVELRRGDALNVDADLDLRCKCAYIQDGSLWAEGWNGEGRKLITAIDESQFSWDALAWAPSGRFLAYAEAGEIIVADVTRKIRRPVTTMQEMSLREGREGELWECEGPAWGPDGAHVAFIARSNRAGCLYVAGVRLTAEEDLPGGVALPPLAAVTGGLTDSGSLSRVGDNFVNVCGWSPTSKMLAAEDEQSRLWLIALDAQMRPLASPASVCVPSAGQAAWSPDGSRLVYTSWENGESRIMLGDGRGNSSTPILATTLGRARKPVWSFDGAHVAYILETAAEGEIVSEVHVLSIGEATEDKLVYRTDPSSVDERAVVLNGFTPDGEAVVFSLGSPQAPNVYRVSVKGGAPEAMKARAALFSYSGGLPTTRYRSLKVFLQDLFATFEAEDLGRLTELCLPVLERVDASGKSKEELWGDKRGDALLKMIKYVGPSGVAQASQTTYSGGDGRFEHVVVLGGSGRKLFLSRGDGRWYVAGFYLTD